MPRIPALLATRRRRRGLGKRRLYRECRRDAARVIELSRQGLSEGAISSSVGISGELVSEILRLAGEVEDNAALPAYEGGMVTVGEAASEARKQSEIV
jgi:hypothetical protein